MCMHETSNTESDLKIRVFVRFFFKLETLLEQRNEITINCSWQMNKPGFFSTLFLLHRLAVS